MSTSNLIVLAILIILAIVTTFFDGIKTTLAFAGVGIGLLIIGNLSLGYLSMLAGLVFAGVITWKWFQSAEGSLKGISVFFDDSLRNFHPASLILRIYLAVILYFALCKYDLLPSFLVYVPEFISERFF